jgi:enolase
VQDNGEAMEVLMDAIQKSRSAGKVKIGADVAASEFWKPDIKEYDWLQKKKQRRLHEEDCKRDDCVRIRIRGASSEGQEIESGVPGSIAGPHTK